MSTTPHRRAGFILGVLLLLLTPGGQGSVPGAVQTEDLLLILLLEVGRLLADHRPCGLLHARRSDRTGTRAKHGREDLGMARIGLIPDPVAIEPEDPVEGTD